MMKLMVMAVVLLVIMAKLGCDCPRLFCGSSSVPWLS